MSYMVGREDKRTNNRTMIPTLKNNAAASYQGPVKKELLEGAVLLHFRGSQSRALLWSLSKLMANVSRKNIPRNILTLGFTSTVLEIIRWLTNPTFYLAVTNFTRFLSPRSSVWFEFQLKDASSTVYTLLPDFNRGELNNESNFETKYI